MVMNLTRTSRYPAKVFWSDEDKGFIAVAEDLPGCSAIGDSQSEALDQLQEAIEAWIAAAEAAGNSIPLPSVSVSPSGFSGKVLVRMPRHLHAELVSSAASENVSLNQYIVYLLTLQFAMQQVNSNVFTQSAALGPLSGTNTPVIGRGIFFSGGGTFVVGGPPVAAGFFHTSIPGHSSIEMSTTDWAQVTPHRGTGAHAGG